MAIKIDKNVPVARSNSDIIPTVSQMNIGDSVFVPTRAEMSSFRSAIRYAGFKAVSRKEGNGYRIWKTERSDRQ
jgi:hypothetical protein